MKITHNFVPWATWSDGTNLEDVCGYWTAQGLPCLKTRTAHPKTDRQLSQIEIGSQQWRDLDLEERYRRKIIDIENEYLEKMKLHDQRVAIFGVYVVLILLAIFSIIAYAVAAK